MQDVKMQDMKMTDQVAGHEIAEQASFKHFGWSKDRQLQSAV